MKTIRKKSSLGNVILMERGHITELSFLMDAVNKCILITATKWGTTQITRMLQIFEQNVSPVCRVVWCVCLCVCVCYQPKILTKNSTRVFSNQRELLQSVVATVVVLL